MLPVWIVRQVTQLSAQARLGTSGAGVVCHIPKKQTYHDISVTDNHTIFVSLGTKKVLGIITQVNPKPKVCALKEKCKMVHNSDLHVYAHMFLYCCHCHDWKHAVCIGIKSRRFQQLTKSEAPFQCNYGKCKNSATSSESDAD